MAMWRVTSDDGHRWVTHDGADWQADTTTARAMRQMAGRPVEAAPNADLYEPHDRADEVGLYLLARYLVPGPQHITGTPPAVPADPTPYPAGTIF